MDLSLDAPIQWDKKNGGLLNAPYDIKDKRAEHFSDLCNQASDIDLSIADDIDQHWIIKSMTHPFEAEEIDEAVHNTKFRGSQALMGFFLKY